MKTWTLKEKLIGLIVVLLTFLVFACGFGFWGISRLNGGAGVAIGRLNDALEAHTVIISALKTYQNQADTIINQKSDGKEFAASYKELTDAAKRFSALADTDEEKAWAAEMEKNLIQFTDLYTKEILPRVTRLLAAKDSAEQVKIEEEIRAVDGRTDNVLKAITDNTEKGIFSLEKEAKLAQENYQASGKRIKAALIAISLVAVALGFGVGWWIAQGITKTVSRIAGSLSTSSDQTVAAASQVSSASQSLAEGASEQAASLEETSSSLEEMSSMTKRNAESAKKAKDLADSTKSASEEGVRSVQSMSQSMDRIQVSSDDLRTAMGSVKASNNEVAKIIKTIDEIAFQTNILALNAAVEAARAGEAGMGFAVVADEVRNLAQKSAEAARETASKIESAIGRTEAGVRVSDKVVEDLKLVLEQSRQVEASLKGIEQKSREVDGLVGEIAAASLEQSQGIEQVNTAVTQMDKLTQSNAANAEESASAAEELNAQAESMRDAVGELLALIGGTRVDPGLKSQTRPYKTGAASKPCVSRPAPSNGRIPMERTGAGPTTASVRGNAGNGLPMAGDFKDF
jgi:methyl-accepting chemotaxis protein